VKRIGMVGALTFAGMCFTGSAASALDLGEWVPGLKLSPFLSERFEYNTNVFQTPSHSQSDEIFKTIPGIVADYTFGPHSLSAGYRAEILNYVHLTDQDTVHHIAAGQLRLDFPQTLLTLKEDFTRTSDPPNTELTGPILSNTNVLKPEGEYRLTQRFSTGLSYTWTRVRFDEASIGDLIDRDEHLFGASVYWKVVPKADLYLRYDGGFDTFTEATDRNFVRHQVWVGVRGELTAKLSSSLHAGVEIRVPDQPGQEGFTGLIFGGDLTYRPTERATITLLVDRSTEESTFGTSVFYVTTNGTLTAQYQLLPKLSIGAHLGGGVNDYSTKQTVGNQTDWRHDSFLDAGAQVDYTIQPWLRVGLEYLRTSRASNFSLFQFVEDKITARVTLQF
jgi:hypothetical protein